MRCAKDGKIIARHCKMMARKAGKLVSKEEKQHRWKTRSESSDKSASANGDMSRWYSRRMGVPRGPKYLLGRWAPSLGMGRGLPCRNTPLRYVCYLAQCGRSSSSGTSVITEIRPDEFDPRVQSFKVTQRTDMDPSATYDFLLVIHRTVSEQCLF